MKGIFIVHFFSFSISSIDCSSSHIPLLVLFQIHDLSSLIVTTYVSVNVSIHGPEAYTKNNRQPGMVAHTFNPSTQEAEAGRYL